MNNFTEIKLFILKNVATAHVKRAYDMLAA